MMTAGTRCGDAPFIFPTDGLAGFIWDDYSAPVTATRNRHFRRDGGRRHACGRGVPGYLTRQSDWKSTVIIRVPDDPLQARTADLGVLYSHGRSTRQFLYLLRIPRRHQEVYVEAGTFLGYQGNYSGDPNNPVGVHLHISIVKDDGFGNFKNELEIENTYDPRHISVCH